MVLIRQEPFEEEFYAKKAEILKIVIMNIAHLPIKQIELRFFGGYTGIEPPTSTDITEELDRNNLESAFYGVIGNDSAIDQICDILFNGLLKSSHCIGPGGIALVGAPSTGKTMLAHRIGQATGLPFIECDRNIKSTKDLLLRMEEIFRSKKIPLIPLNPGQAIKKYKCPPGIVLFDEAHALRGDWLLKATEPKDGQLITENAVVDCQNIFWIICTTHRGKLPKAFDSRFQKIFLQNYNLTEVAQIVQLEFPEFSFEVAQNVALYGGCIPREAISFGKQVKLSAERHQSTNWREICKKVAERKGVDEEGFDSQHLMILTTLYNNNGVASLKHVSDHVGLPEEDLEEYILPFLIVQTMIKTNTRGIQITHFGIEALNKRGLTKKTE